jgi:hypothetical protein
MRAILLSAILAAAVLVVAPTAGASCHMCLDPVGDYLRQFLP